MILTLTVITFIARVGQASIEKTAELALMERLRNKYSHLSSFTMHVDHQDSSGLFQGKYSQNLHWLKKDVFELIASNTDSKNATTLPNYYASGGDVLERIASYPDRHTPVTISTGTVAGWEIGGGYIVSWLQSTPMGESVLRDPARYWTFGPRSTWHGLRCRELQRHLRKSGAQGQMSIFIDDKALTLLGLETHILHKVGWDFYTKQTFNPTLPAATGRPPR